METQLIHGSPCPLCGEVAFALDWSPPPEIEDYACLSAEDVTESHLNPCECTGCGNVHMVVTRT